MSADDLRLQPKQSEERSIALLVRMVPFEDAVALIEQYGRTKVSEGRCDHAAEVYNRCVDSRGGVDA